MNTCGDHHLPISSTLFSGTNFALADDEVAEQTECGLKIEVSTPAACMTSAMHLERVGPEACVEPLDTMNTWLV